MLEKNARESYRAADITKGAAHAREVQRSDSWIARRRKRRRIMRGAGKSIRVYLDATFFDRCIKRERERERERRALCACA